MVDVQRGTLKLPILIQPRINGVVVTQLQIKSTFSNAFIDDSTTPLTWTLEYSSRAVPTPVEVLYNAGKSTDNTIFFDIPDVFYADYNLWTIMIFWKVTDNPVTSTLEQIYSNEAIQIDVKDLQLGL